MKTVNQHQVVLALGEVGINAGDGVLVHSAIQFLGRPDPGPELYLHALQEAVGESGTIAVPTFNFGFARGEPFDLQKTPAEGMGVLSEMVRTHPDSVRTPHPLQSLSVIGPLAEDLAGRDTPAAFDPGSAFDRMIELDFTLLLLGATVQAASLIHWSEQRMEVPYRFWKSFMGEVIRDGRRSEKEYRMYARDLDIDPQLNLTPIQWELQAQGLWRETTLNYGTVRACSAQDFVQVTTRLLQEDPWALVDSTALASNPDEVRS